MILLLKFNYAHICRYGFNRGKWYSTNNNICFVFLYIKKSKYIPHIFKIMLLILSALAFKFNGSWNVHFLLLTSLSLPFSFCQKNWVLMVEIAHFFFYFNWSEVEVCCCEITLSLDIEKVLILSQRKFLVTAKCILFPHKNSPLKRRIFLWISGKPFNIWDEGKSWFKFRLAKLQNVLFTSQN